MANQDWKDAAQELPDNDREVLIATHDGHVGTGYYYRGQSIDHNPHTWLAYDNGEKYEERVTHWQDKPIHPSKIAATPEVEPWPESIHSWFGLSYASYLVIPRLVLQSMSLAWQAKFVALLNEMNDTIDWSLPHRTAYHVQLKRLESDTWADDFWGEVVDDPYADYQRGRRRLPLRTGDTSYE